MNRASTIVRSVASEPVWSCNSIAKSPSSCASSADNPATVCSTINDALTLVGEASPVDMARPCPVLRALATRVSARQGGKGALDGYRLNRRELSDVTVRTLRIA